MVANLATINDINENDYQSAEEILIIVCQLEYTVIVGVHIDLMISKNSAIICIRLNIQFFSDLDYFIQIQ